MSPPLDRRTFVTRSAATLAASVAGVPMLGRAQSAPLKLGIISAATYAPTYNDPAAARMPGSHHGTAFSTTFNGWDEVTAKQMKGTFVKSGRRLEGARVVKIWDPDKTAARTLADVCGIETVTDTPEQCCDGVDAVLIVDDGSGAQWK
jgi:hypothetical protein